MIVHNESKTRYYRLFIKYLDLLLSYIIIIIIIIIEIKLLNC